MIEIPEHFRFREGTHDREIWRCVVGCDEYRMMHRTIHPDDIVIDIGAHIGCFAWLARRVCLNVHAFEPFIDNYTMAVMNSGARCRPYAVWRSDRSDYGVLPYQSSTCKENTGGGDVFGGSDLVESVSLDGFIRDENIQKIRLIKIDCEGSEFPILLTSKYLHLADEIIGEYHELPYGDKTIPDYAAVTGVSEFSRDVLRGCLERNGFDVEINHEAENIGKFFAKRIS